MTSPDVTRTLSLAGTPAPPGSATDLELLERWGVGDERAASLLVSRHGPALVRFAAALGVRDEIEELVQDTFVRAFAALRDFRGESSLLTWLFTIERRLILDRQRASRRTQQVALDASIPATGGTALDALVAREAEARLQQAIASLGGLQRTVFVLRVAEGLSYREIAEVAGTTEGAARVHYHHAVRAVKEQLGD